MSKHQSVLITASTYPRWERDSTPDFVEQFAYSIAKDLKSIYVAAPHFKNAQVREHRKNITIHRYRYFFPTSQENITYNGGGVYKIRKTPLYAFKLACLLTVQFFVTLTMTLRYQVDVLNPHWVIPQGFIAILVKFLTRRKVVLTVHGGDVVNLTGRVMTAIKRFVLKHSDEVCVNSIATKQVCENIYPREYNVIPMGIHMERFFKTTPSIDLSEKFKLNSFTILFVGRLTEVKGVKYLLAALKQLDSEGREFKAIIAGDGPLRPEFEDYVTRHDLNAKIQFPGWVPQEELNDFYNMADVFVGPSLKEPQGLVFVEALAAGTPVIASNVGGIVDIVDDEKTGFLVEPKSSDALAKAIATMMDNPAMCKRFSSYARASVEERFSWKTIASDYQSVFERV